MITRLIRALVLVFLVPLMLILGIMKGSEYVYNTITYEPDYEAGVCLRKPEAIGRGDEFYPPELIVEVLDGKYITCRGVPYAKKWSYCELSSKSLMNNKKYYVQTECPEYTMSNFVWKKQNGQ